MFDEQNGNQTKGNLKNDGEKSAQTDKSKRSLFSDDVRSQFSEGIIKNKPKYEEDKLDINDDDDEIVIDDGDIETRGHDIKLIKENNE